MAHSDNASLHSYLASRGVLFSHVVFWDFSSQRLRNDPLRIFLLFLLFGCVLARFHSFYVEGCTVNEHQKLCHLVLGWYLSYVIARLFSSSGSSKSMSKY